MFLGLHVIDSAEFLSSAHIDLGIGLRVSCFQNLVETLLYHPLLLFYSSFITPLSPFYTPYLDSLLILRQIRYFNQLSNAIEPFLQPSTDDETLNKSTPGKFTPQPSIGLVRSQSRERSWGATLEGGKSGIKLFLTEMQQANIYAALNRALVHIAR